MCKQCVNHMLILQRKKEKRIYKKEKKKVLAFTNHFSKGFFLLPFTYLGVKESMVYKLYLKVDEL